MVRIERKVGGENVAVRVENAGPQTSNLLPLRAGSVEASAQHRRQMDPPFIVIGSREIDFEAKNGSTGGIVIAKINLIARIGLHSWQNRCRRLR